MGAPETGRGGRGRGSTRVVAAAGAVGSGCADRRSCLAGRVYAAQTAIAHPAVEPRRPSDGQRARLTAAASRRKSASTLACPADPGPAPAVLSAHQVRELAFDLGPGGPVVGDSRLGVGLPGAGRASAGSCGADADGAPARPWCTACRSGQPAQRRAEAGGAGAVRPRRIGAVCPAGQVTASASRSMANSSLVNKPPAAVGALGLAPGSRSRPGRAGRGTSRCRRRCRRRPSPAAHRRRRRRRRQARPGRRRLGVGLPAVTGSPPRRRTPRRRLAARASRPGPARAPRRAGRRSGPRRRWRRRRCPG